jgi:hypothetical protein
MNTLNIFNAYGAVRDLSDDATVAEIEALPDDQRKTLFECVAAVKASAVQQEKIRVQRGEVRRLEVVYNQALAADLAANKPTDHATALRAVVAANAGQKLPPEGIKKIEKEIADLKAAHAKASKPRKVKTKTEDGKEVIVETTDEDALRSITSEIARKNEMLAQMKLPKEALEAATVALADARAVLNVATHALPALQRAESAAIIAWRGCLTTPDRLAVVRDYQQRSQDEKIARVKNGQPATPAPVVSPHRSPIDARFANRGKVENRLPAFMGKH